VKINKLFFLVILFPLLSSGQEPISNIDWIGKNIHTILDSLDVKKSFNNRSLKIDFGAVKGEKKGFIKSQVLSHLNQVIPGEEENNFISFHIEQFNTSIVYEQNSDGFLSLNTYYLRKNNITFIGWIENEASKPIKSFNINKIFSEKLDIDNLREIEESPYSFSKGETRDLSLWTSTIEPILVGSSIAVIVYLFFSVRS